MLQIVIYKKINFWDEYTPLKIRLTCQKVFPLPTVGALSASNSPSALSA